jgi:hypothetical protein
MRAISRLQEWWWRQDWWWRFGEVRALPLISCVFALGLLLGLFNAVGVRRDVAAWAVALALVAALIAFIAYCLARPRGGWTVFGTASMPGAASSLLHAITGAPRWIGVLLVPLALLLIWDEDRRMSQASVVDGRRDSERDWPGASSGEPE